MNSFALNLKYARHNNRSKLNQFHSIPYSQMYQHKFLEMKKANDELLREIAGKAANIKMTEANFTKLQNSYDLLLTDFK